MPINGVLKKIDIFLDKQTGLFLNLFLLVILRIPNFFEPYWYGDEAIYLSVGNALNKGGLLYTTIIDHKTPLIYQFARVPNQFIFVSKLGLDVNCDYFFLVICKEII